MRVGRENANWIQDLLMFAWIMNRPINFFGPVFGLPMVGLGSLAVQRSINDLPSDVATPRLGNRLDTSFTTVAVSSTERAS